MGGINSLIPNINSTTSIFPDFRRFPILLGMGSGLGFGILQSLGLHKLQRGQNSLVTQGIEDSKAIYQTAPSGAAKIMLAVKQILEGFVSPLNSELIFRDALYTYVENNFKHARIINFIVAPILFGALNFDPRIKPSYYLPLTYASLGGVLAILRKTTGTIRSPLTAHIVSIWTFGCVTGAIAINKMRQEILEQRKKQIENTTGTPDVDATNNATMTEEVSS